MLACIQIVRDVIFVRNLIVQRTAAHISVSHVMRSLKHHVCVPKNQLIQVYRVSPKYTDRQRLRGDGKCDFRNFVQNYKVFLFLIYDFLKQFYAPISSKELTSADYSVPSHNHLYYNENYRL